MRAAAALPELRDAPGRPGVAYGPLTAAEPHFRAAVGELIDTPEGAPLRAHPEGRRQAGGGAKRICDVGGGAKPVVGLPRVREAGLEYVVLDESSEQLERAPSGYDVVTASILDTAAIDRLVAERGAFDAVISRWTAEHIPDGRAFHESVFRMLRPGGVAVHQFPTLYVLPFMANKLLSSQASSAVLFRLFPEREAKFPAYYSWCRGPTARQLARVRSTGFEIERYVGFFGHAFYARVPPVHRAHKALTRALIRHPLPALTSFALVVLRRPE